MATIRTIMKSNLISVQPETPIAEAIGLLVKHRISGLPVTSQDGTIVGVVTEKDVLPLFAEPASDVAAVMTPNPEMFAVDAPLVDVVDCLMAKSYRRVLIHEGGKLVGLISRADLMPAILDLLLDDES